MVQSVCPYCAVGCGQRVFVKDEKVVQIEGDPDSPISRGRLCPKGSASEQLVNSDRRARRSCSTAGRTARSGSRSTSRRATDMIADRVVGHPRRAPGRTATTAAAGCRRTLGLAGLGGATLDNEENYLIKKLFTALGAIQIENQARI